MIKKKKYIIVSAFIAVVILTGVAINKYYMPSIPEMFKLNKQLQEEGYYMAEFEFKMLGLVYKLDRGKYGEVYSQLNGLYRQLKSREGLIKLPKFESKKNEMEFYLNLQNKKTGAFMDDSYPLCTYSGPTGNVLNHLDLLAQETGQPLKLKYPLKFLDELNTPDKIKRYLDDVSTVGWIGMKFPQNSFHFTRCFLSLFHEDGVIEKYNMYKVTPDMKEALLQWFYEKQDPESGLWGPRSKKGKLLKKDTSNTAPILKAFVDSDGNNLHKNFPLRYKSEMAKSILEESFNQLPEDDELDEWHEWCLNTPKSIRMITRYLWDGLSEDERVKAKDLIEYYVRVKFEKFYKTDEGAFSYYPGSEHATLDGTGVIGDFKNYGFFSKEKQIQLWGKPETNCIDAGSFNISEMTEKEIGAIIKIKNINSIRFYAIDPIAGNYTTGVLGVFYPKKTSVLDIMDFIPKTKTWITSTSQSMGNWTSRENLLQLLLETKIKSVPILKNEMPIEELNKALTKNKKLILIGFDVLQVPRSKITYNSR